MSNQRVTLSTIASLTGVNASTVSRALNPRTSHLVEVHLRSRIQSVCDEHNFRPRVTGRSFVTGKTFKVGFISGEVAKDLSSPLCAQLLASLAEALQARNYSLTILPYTGMRNSDSLRQLLMSDVADGYILGVAMLDAQTRDILVSSGRLVIALDLRQNQVQDDFSSLVLEYLPAYRQIWQSLPVSWHQEVLFIGAESASTDYKLAKMRQAAASCGVAEDEIAVQLLKFQTMDFTLNFRYAFIYGEEHWRTLAKYRLLWCASDLTAIGLADALSRRGLRIGTDICLLGQDNIESLYGQGYQPQLTTVDPMMQDAGIQTAELMLQHLANPQHSNKPRRIELQSRIVFRDSLPEKLLNTNTSGGNQ